MKYRIYADRLKLIRSCDIPKAKFARELDAIRSLHPACPVWSRSERSLRLEWAAHNLAYSLGIRRDKTKDADLNYEQKWYVKLAYWLAGTVALWVIK